MRLYTIKFANGLYLSRLNVRPAPNKLGSPITADINEAYVHHDIENLIYKVEGSKDLFPGAYNATMENGGGSYKLVEVKITEVEDESN